MGIHAVESFFVRAVESKAATFGIGLIGGVIGGMLPTLFRDALYFGLKRVGDVHFMIVKSSFITHGRFDRDTQKVMPAIPMFVEFTVQLNIVNKSYVQREMTLFEVTLCKDEPVWCKKEDAWLLGGAMLSQLGFKTEDESGKETKVIRIAPRSMTSVVLTGTMTNPAYGGQAFREWKWVAMRFQLPSSEMLPLSWKVCNDDGFRQCDLNVKPTFKVPDHYADYQSGKHADPALRRALDETLT